jgi:hypothetical protein
LIATPSLPRTVNSRARWSAPDDERVPVTGDVAALAGHGVEDHGDQAVALGITVFSSASFIYFGCAPDKSWSIWLCGTISPCCINWAR